MFLATNVSKVVFRLQKRTWLHESMLWRVPATLQCDADMLWAADSIVVSVRSRSGHFRFDDVGRRIDASATAEHVVVDE